MTCDQPKSHELAERYVAGKLSPTEIETFEDHFFECDECSQRVLLLEEARADLATRPLLPQYQSTSRVRWKFLVPLMAAVILAAGVTWMETRQFRAPDPQPTPATRSTPAAEKAQASVVDKSRENLPVNNRDYLRFATTSSAVAKDKPRKISPAPTSGLNLGKARLPEEVGTEKPPVEKEPSETAIAEKTASQPRLAPEKTGTPDPEIAAALFRLGEIDPPPYSFAGFGQKSKMAHSSTGVERGARPSQSKVGSEAHGEQLVQLEKFRAGMNAYVDRDYRNAADLLRQAADATPDLPEIFFYLGICQLELGKPAEAVRELQRAADFGDPALQSMARYFLAKALIQNYRPDAAKEQLQQNTNDGGRYATKSATLLQQLNDVIGKQPK